MNNNKKGDQLFATESLTREQPATERAHQARDRVEQRAAVPARHTHSNRPLQTLALHAIQEVRLLALSAIDRRRSTAATKQPKRARSGLLRPSSTLHREPRVHRRFPHETQGSLSTQSQPVFA